MGKKQTLASCVRGNVFNTLQTSLPSLKVTHKRALTYSSVDPTVYIALIGYVSNLDSFANNSKAET